MWTCVSVDMDNYAEYRSLIDPDGDREGPSFIVDAVPRFLDAFDAAGVRATFFLVGRDCDRPEQRRVVRQIAERGHEVANHSFTHPYDFSDLAPEVRAAQIDDCAKAIADTTGEPPVGFRAPSGNIDSSTLELLAERGYLYDSSIIPSSLMWAFMVYGKLFVRHERYKLGRPAAVLCPRDPYLPAADRFYAGRRAGAPGPDILEIPVSVTPRLGIPFYATLLRIAGGRVFDGVVRMHGRRPVLHTIFHVIDLVDHRGTSLDAALARTPGLGVSFERRQRFVRHALATLTGVAESVPLREVARAHRGLAAGSA